MKLIIGLSAIFLALGSISFAADTVNYRSEAVADITGSDDLAVADTRALNASSGAVGVYDGTSQSTLFKPNVSRDKIEIFKKLRDQLDKIQPLMRRLFKAEPGSKEYQDLARKVEDISHGQYSFVVYRSQASNGAAAAPRAYMFAAGEAKNF